jgi:hypothetical protein
MNRRVIQRSQYSLATRVQALVDRFFGGSVNAAAASWRVPQPTLKRICDGTTLNPRVESLRRIASAQGTTVEWLLSGLGPEDPLATVSAPVATHREAAEWYDLVASLGLPLQEGEETELLPDEIGGAFEVLLGALPRLESADKRDRVGSAWTEAERHCHRAWSLLLSTLLSVFGKPAVRAALQQEPLALTFGFREPTLELLQQKGVRARAEKQIRAARERSQQVREIALATVHRRQSDSPGE